MSKIKGKDLLKLGFKREEERTSEAPNMNLVKSWELEEYHYYTYEVSKHALLISCSSDEKDADGGYYVEFYEIPELKFTKLKDLKKLFKLLKKVTK